MLEVTNEVSALHEVESIAALNLDLGSPSQSSNVKLLSISKYDLCLLHAGKTKETFSLRIRIRICQFTMA